MTYRSIAADKARKARIIKFKNYYIIMHTRILSKYIIMYRYL